MSCPSCPFTPLHMMTAFAGDLIPPELRSFSEGLASLYIPPQPESSLPWGARHPIAVFRGKCHPTIDVDEEKPSQRIFPRAAFCKVHGKSRGFDVGVYNENASSPCATPEGEAMHSWCQDCRLCSDRAPYTPTEMRQFRYQLVIDGHGPAFDATAWKLSSGSTCFFLQSEDTTAAQLFYYPLLSPYSSYIPITVDNATNALAYCASAPTACEAIASQAFATISTVLDFDFLLEYIQRILQTAYSRK